MIQKKLLSNILFLLSFSIAFVLLAPDITTGQVDRTKKFIEAENAAVATASPEASRIALEILKQGGNAVDAAIAAAYALGVLEPNGSGLGGGGNALVYIKSEGRHYNLDFYPRSPMNPLSFTPGTDEASVRAVSVPGFVAGMEELRERWAVLDREAHIRPSVEIAREGFVPDSVLYSRIHATHSKLLLYEESKELFTENGQPVGRDFVLRNPALADVMEEVIEGGRDAFYRGELAARLINGLNEHGGTFTAEDFSEFAPVWRDPVRGTYRGYDIIASAPPVAGLLVIQSLQMLEHFDFSRYGHYTESPETMHFLIELFKRSYADRLSFIGDPDFFDVPATGLASRAFARNRVSDIRMGMANHERLRDTEPGNPFNFNDASVADADWERGVPDDFSWFFTDDLEDDASSYDWWGDDKFDSWGAQRDEQTNRRRGGFLQTIFRSSGRDTVRVEIEDDDDWVPDTEEEPEEGQDNTTHITVIDADGNMVSLTSTVGLLFGSGITIDGVVMNSGQANFGSTAVNNMRPGRIPRSTIAPTMVMQNGDPFLVIGAAGGARIPVTVTMAISNIIDFGMDVFEANAAPRFISRRWADEVEFEGLVPQDIVIQMRRIGHPVRVRRPIDVYFGGMQIIKVRQDGIIEASSDPRRDGSPAGY
ncbi:MAG: gamma-glutamyltransferase [Balneolales bacterium]|nr:gamma-glutamyltransferase [Balneolales bacterium]